MLFTPSQQDTPRADGAGSETVTPCPWGGDFRVTVSPAYNHLHSRPDDGSFVFVYHVTIRNESDRPATLVARRWTIIDADGQRREVEGEGVVGAQPTIEPGESYEYASFCPLETPWGTMEGAYTLVADGAGVHDIRIGRFYLTPPSESDHDEDPVETGSLAGE